MSISNRHTVVPFVAGETKPLSGQRLAKVGYKTTAKTPAKFPSIAVSVPQIQVADVRENYDALLPHIATLLENAQDGIVRSLYESRDGALSEVSDDDISVRACIAFLDAEAAGDRLTKDAIQRWFDRELKDSLYVLVAEKLGFTSGDPSEAQDRTIQKHVQVYRDVFSMLAGGKTILQEKQIKGCKTALSLIDLDDLGKKLESRLNVMEKKERIEDLLEL